MATNRLRSWFFQITSELRADGTVGGVRLRKTDKPTQQTFEDLLQSTAFKTESSDRARVSTGATVGSEQGLAVLASDVQAKSNATQLADRSLVTQPHQLPTVESTASSSSEDMPTTNFAVDLLASISRNQYGLRLASAWINWLISRLFKQGGIEGDVPIKTSGTNYAWQYQNPGNNTTIVNAIAGNSTFITSLLANSTFISNITNTIITSNPAAITEALEVGFMRVHPIAAMPSAKWLRCDGSAISRATYSALFTLIGTTYGVGDGSTTFNLPDIRDRKVTGYSGTKAIGSTGGAETHTLLTTNLPAHNHPVGTLAGTTSADGDHGHATNITTASGPGTDPGLGIVLGTAVTTPYASGSPLPTSTHTHTLSITGSTGDTGSGTAVTHLDPYIACNFIIKVTA